MGRLGTSEALALTPGQLQAPSQPQPSTPGVPCIQMILLFIDCSNRSITTQNLQLNADIILEIYVSIKKQPIQKNKAVFVRGALCIFIKALKGNQGWGLRRRGLGGCRRADFPTVYMLISNLTAPVLELFLQRMQILFFSFCYRLF